VLTDRLASRIGTVNRAVVALERIAKALLVERPKDDGPNVVERIANVLEVMEEESLYRIADAADGLSECLVDYGDGEGAVKAFRVLPCE
jgi:hypothetical protein